MKYILRACRAHATTTSPRQEARVTHSDGSPLRFETLGLAIQHGRRLYDGYREVVVGRRTGEHVLIRYEDVIEFTVSSISE